LGTARVGVTETARPEPGLSCVARIGALFTLAGALGWLIF
jgi:hypothetical protein